MKKSIFNWMTIIMVVCVSVCFASCSSDDDEKTGIVGTWVDGSTTMVLGSDGSYNLTDTSYDSITQYRRGTYSYNSKQGLLTINVVASGQNNAYQQTYIVQTLTATTLVLLYTDGDVQGYYTRK